MTKPREPRSFEDAITRIIADLGAEAAAEAVGKSTSMVRQWSDPDVEILPNLKQAALLDAAYGRRFGDLPIGKTYAHVAQGLCGGRGEHKPGCPLERVTDCVRETAEAVDSYRAYHAVPTPAQAGEVKREATEAIEALEKLIRDVEAEQADQVRLRTVA